MFIIASHLDWVMLDVCAVYIVIHIVKPVGAASSNHNSCVACNTLTKTMKWIVQGH